MASPFLPYENARFLVIDEGVVSLVNGRWNTSELDKYLLKLWIKRAQYGGVSSGSKKIPLPSQLDGEMLPGASGDQFYYRGYSLQYAQVTTDWDLETSDESSLTWVDVTSTPDWLSTGQEGQFRFGNDPIMPSARIERSSGVFGGQGIDEIIYKGVGGVEIQITGSELET